MDQDRNKRPPLGGSSLLSVRVPDGLSESYWRSVTRYQLIYSLCGLVFGLAFAVFGGVLFINGVSGNTSWTASFIGFNSQISDAAPGTVLFIVGLFTILFTRFDVKQRA